LEGDKRLVLSLPVGIQAGLFLWVLRLRNVVDEIWLVDVDKAEVVNVVNPLVFRGGKVRGRVSVDYLGERCQLPPPNELGGLSLKASRMLKKVLRDDRPIDIGPCSDVYRAPARCYITSLRQCFSPSERGY
jgi:hypothetical protein